MADLRIALLTHSVNPRGGVVHVLELGRALCALGHRVTVVAPAAKAQQLFRASPCEIDLAPLDLGGATSLHDTVRARIAAMRAHLAARIRGGDFDLVHAHDGIGGNAMLDLRDAGLAVALLRTVHHVDTFGDARVQALEERSIRGADRLLCVSAVWCDALRERFGIEAAQVANGVDLARFSPPAAAQRSPRDAALAQRLGLRGGPVVLTVGGIEARKNTPALLDAFIALRARFSQAQLVVAGGASLLDHRGAAHRFAATARAAGLSIGAGGDIIPAGVLHDDEMPALYRCADVLAMPSTLEGFGLAALEARACGTPAVVSRIAPFTEHFGEHDVHWCDPHDTASIADALRRAIADRSRERPAVCERYGWAVSAQRHVALYRALLDTNPRNSDARDALPAAMA